MNKNLLSYVVKIIAILGVTFGVGLAHAGATIQETLLTLRDHAESNIDYYTNKRKQYSTPEGRSTCKDLAMPSECGHSQTICECKQREYLADIWEDELVWRSLGTIAEQLHMAYTEDLLKSNGTLTSEQNAEWQKRLISLRTELLELTYRQVRHLLTKISRLSDMETIHGVGTSWVKDKSACSITALIAFGDLANLYNDYSALTVGSYFKQVKTMLSSFNPCFYRSLNDLSLIPRLGLETSSFYEFSNLYLDVQGHVHRNPKAIPLLNKKGDPSIHSSAWQMVEDGLEQRAHRRKPNQNNNSISTMVSLFGETEMAHFSKELVEGFYKRMDTVALGKTAEQKKHKNAKKKGKEKGVSSPSSIQTPDQLGQSLEALEVKEAESPASSAGSSMDSRLEFDVFNQGSSPQTKLTECHGHASSSENNSCQEMPDNLGIDFSNLKSSTSFDDEDSSTSSEELFQPIRFISKVKAPVHDSCSSSTSIRPESPKLIQLSGRAAKVYLTATGKGKAMPISQKDFEEFLKQVGGRIDPKATGGSKRGYYLPNLNMERTQEYVYCHLDFPHPKDKYFKKGTFKSIAGDSFKRAGLTDGAIVDF